MVQRNVHSSTIDGIILAGLEPTFVAPELDDDLGVAHCLTPESLAEALDRSPDAVAALTVSPTYFGAVADVAGLAEVATSAACRWSSTRPGGLICASRRCCRRARWSAAPTSSSPRSTSCVGSLTQSAILHLGADGLIDEDVVDRCVTLTESTSPSALLTASLDAARRLRRGQRAGAARRDPRGRRDGPEPRSADPGLDVLDERLVGRPGVHGWDPLRLSIDVRGTGSTGTRVASLMRELDDINLELVSENVVVAAFGMGEDAARERGALRRRPAQRGRDAGRRGGSSEAAVRAAAALGKLEMPPREAFFGPQEVVPFEEAVGRVAAESLAAYPPGIPNVLPGERLTQETVDYIREVVEHGGWVRGAVDRSLRTIRVVSE